MLVQVFATPLCCVWLWSCWNHGEWTWTSFGWFQLKPSISLHTDRVNADAWTKHAHDLKNRYGKIENSQKKSLFRPCAQMSSYQNGPQRMPPREASKTGQPAINMGTAHTDVHSDASHQIISCGSCVGTRQQLWKLQEEQRQKTLESGCLTKPTHRRHQKPNCLRGFPRLPAPTPLPACKIPHNSWALAFSNSPSCKQIAQLVDTCPWHWRLYRVYVASGRKGKAFISINIQASQNAKAKTMQGGGDSTWPKTGKSSH